MKVSSKILIISAVILTFSCSRDEDQTPLTEINSSSYFPLEIGHTVIYDIKEIIFRNNGHIRDTLAYQLKEEMVGTYNDDVGDLIYIVDRSTRKSVVHGWNYVTSWQSQITGNQAIRTEDNRKYVKLILPLRANEVWDANALFDDTSPRDIGGNQINYFKNWQSRLMEENGSFTMNETKYDDVHTVSLADYENKLELRYGREVYAKSIGLIYREIRVLDTQCFDNCNEMLWEDKAEKGHIYIQKLYN